jgi:hypothetical protein
VGSYDYRVSALDLAGNRGPASNSVTVVVVPFDAGVAMDAGTGLDAGIVDAGVPPDGGSALDAGVSASGSYAVGCGCSKGNGVLVWLAVFAARALSRHTRRPDSDLRGSGRRDSLTSS